MKFSPWKDVSHFFQIDELFSEDIYFVTSLDINHPHNLDKFEYAKKTFALKEVLEPYLELRILIASDKNPNFKEVESFFNKKKHEFIESMYSSEGLEQEEYDLWGKSLLFEKISKYFTAEEVRIMHSNEVINNMLFDFFKEQADYENETLKDSSKIVSILGVKPADKKTLEIQEKESSLPVDKCSLCRGQLSEKEQRSLSMHKSCLVRSSLLENNLDFELSKLTFSSVNSLDLKIGETVAIKLYSPDIAYKLVEILDLSSENIKFLDRSEFKKSILEELPLSDCFKNASHSVDSQSIYFSRVIQSFEGKNKVISLSKVIPKRVKK